MTETAVPTTPASSLDSASVSVVVCVRDEHLHIARCVNSARPLGPVFVVDGGSTDDTIELARQSGAQVVEHEWGGYATQKNWALDNLPLETEWVLLLDADEQLTPALRDEIISVAQRGDVDGWYVPRQNIFLGRLLKHAWWYPDYQLRLFRTAKGRYEDRSVHEHLVLDGVEGFLRDPLMHENLKGIEEFMRRQLLYAALEAREIRRARRGELGSTRRGSFFGSWPDRRRAVKTRIWYRLPGRPVLRFLWMYVVKRGFLDGRQGLVYCQLLAANEVVTNALITEQELAGDA